MLNQNRSEDEPGNFSHLRLFNFIPLHTRVSSLCNYLISSQAWIVLHSADRICIIEQYSHLILWGRWLIDTTPGHVLLNIVSPIISPK